MSDLSQQINDLVHMKVPKRGCYTVMIGEVEVCHRVNAALAESKVVAIRNEIRVMLGLPRVEIDI